MGHGRVSTKRYTGPLAALAAAFAFHAGALAAAEQEDREEVLGNDDVVALVAAGVDNDVIVAKIDATATAFDTSVATLIALSEAGVDAGVLEAMARATRPAPPPSEFAGTPCPGPGVYVDVGDALFALDMDTVARIGDGGLVATAADVAYGILPTRASATIAGAAAALRTTSPRPEFWFCLPAPAAAFDAPAGVDALGFVLVAHKVSRRRDERRFDLARFWLFGASMGPSRRSLRPVAFTEVAPNVFQATPEAPLAPGEYGFYYAAVPSLAAYEYLAVGEGIAGRVFSFGVDEPRPARQED